MEICLLQQCAVVCAAHGEAGGGAAVAEGERRIVRTEGCNIGEGEGGSAAFGGEDNGLDVLRAEPVKSERTPCRDAVSWVTSM